MSERIVKASFATMMGLGLIVSSSVLPGCGGGDNGAAEAKAFDAANPGVTKAAQKEKAGFVGPKGKRLTGPGAQ